MNWTTISLKLLSWSPYVQCYVNYMYYYEVDCESAYIAVKYDYKAAFESPGI